MEPVHLRVEGHDLLAAERFRDDTRHMIEFRVQMDCVEGNVGQYIRRFLSENAYAQMLELQKNGCIRIYRHNIVIEGHLLPERKRRRQVNTKNQTYYWRILPCTLWKN